MFEDMTPREVEDFLKVLEEERKKQNKDLMNEKESLFYKLKRKLFKRR